LNYPPAHIFFIPTETQQQVHAEKSYQRLTKSVTDLRRMRLYKKTKFQLNSVEYLSELIANTDAINYLVNFVNLQFRLLRTTDRVVDKIDINTSDKK
jgi:hypothetical protein